MSTFQSITSGVRYLEIEDDYRAGDDGSIWSRKSGEWKRLKPGTLPSGHLQVRLNGKSRSVHRLVLTAFVGPSPPGMECRHLNGKPADNRLENLAWGTIRENRADAVRHGTAHYLRPDMSERARRMWEGVRHKHGERHHLAKLTDEQVRIIRATIDPIRHDKRVAILAKEMGVTVRTIKQIAQGKKRRSG